MPQNIPLQKQIDKKLLHKNSSAKSFDTKIVVAKISPQKVLWFYFCNIIFCIKIFCITIVCVTNICTFIFGSKETTHAKINVQNFVMQKRLMQNFWSQKKKNACKNNLSKIFDYLVRVHNDKELELWGRGGTGEWTFISSLTRGLISGLVPYYRLPYISKVSSWRSSFIPCRYLFARIIPILDHSGHELNSQIFLTSYFCTRFFLRPEILHQPFLHHKILHIYFDVCCFFAIKNKCTNICDTNNCNTKNFNAKNDVAKIIPQNFLWTYFCNNNFCVKTFCAKDFCVTIFCLFVFATVYSAAYIFVYLIKMTI